MSDTVRSVAPILVDAGNDKNFVFVRLETSDGLVGWGECYSAADRERAIASLVEELGRYAEGRDTARIKDFTRFVYLDFGIKRGSMELFCALSGIEQALWDVVGKSVGRPVSDLLGGRVRDEVRVYANGWSYEREWNRASIERNAERAAQLVEEGFTALKFDPLPGPWRLHITREEERSAVDCVRAVREAVGPDVDLLVEAHRRLAPEPAIRLGKALEELRPFWYEEPVSSRSPEALAEVRAAVDLPIVAGEEVYGKQEILPLLERRSVDILNADVANCGGILELVEIAALAEPFFVAVAPHNYNSVTIALAATAHASAVMANFLITEYFVNLRDVCAELVAEPLRPVGGFVRVPDGPGLGLDLDERALERRGARRFPLRFRR